MSNISVPAAVEKLTHAVADMDADDVLQVYNELFPEELATEEKAHEDTVSLSEHIIAHMNHGLEPEEVVDLWNVVFPADRGVYFNEEDKLLFFSQAQTAE